MRVLGISLLALALALALADGEHWARRGLPSWAPLLVLAGIGAALVALSFAPKPFFGGPGWQLLLIGGAVLLSTIAFPFCLAWAALGEACGMDLIVWGATAACVVGLLWMTHRWFFRLLPDERAELVDTEGSPPDVG